MGSRTLNFNGQDLGQDVTLMLTFTPPRIGTLYKDEFPLAWRILQFPATGRVSAGVTYTPATAFLYPQIESGNVVNASNWQPCALGQKTQLNPDHGFAVPVKGVEDFLSCTNKSSTPASIGIGFYDGDEITPDIIWTKIAVNNTLKAFLSAKMLIYATSDYKQSEMITGDIESPLLWSHDLKSLASVTKLTVAVDPDTGEVSVSTA